MKLGCVHVLTCHDPACEAATMFSTATHSLPQPVDAVYLLVAGRAVAGLFLDAVKAVAGFLSALGVSGVAFAS